jgi:hypothetical protein
MKPHFWKGGEEGGKGGRVICTYSEMREEGGCVHKYWEGRRPRSECEENVKWTKSPPTTTKERKIMDKKKHTHKQQAN